MAYATIANSPPALTIRGQIGAPNGVGETWCGWTLLGDESPLAGIYAKRKCKKGMKSIRFRFYCGQNPQTENQQAWRAVFADAVAAWQGLSELTKQEWRRKQNPPNMTGFNRFLKNYLSTHKL